MEYNAPQKDAIQHGSGPAMVVAGAGTGKTSVIVERIIRLIESGVDKQAVLALTFTEKAAQEMLDRVADRLPGSFGVELNILTFNAFGANILREFAPEIGLTTMPRLIGDVGKAVLLRDNLDMLDLDYFAPVSSPDSQVTAIGDYFSRLKQQLVKPNDYKTYADKLPSSTDEEMLEKKRHQELAQAYGTYQRITRESGVVDYDDQIYLLVELLETRPNIQKRLKERFEYVLVDEFQDTNPMQAKLIDLILNDTQNIMVVGDDDQSIYGWRGATLANMMEFSERYPNTKFITLIDNYRSTQGILDAAHTLIQFNNPSRLEAINNLDKKLVAHSEVVASPRLERFDTIQSELDWIAQDVKARLEKKQEPGSIAVLTRRNAGARRIAEMLEYYGIEYVLAGDVEDLYSHPIIKSMVVCLTAVVDPSDNSALHHTLTGPVFSVDPHTIGDISAKSRRTHELLSNALAGTSEAEEPLSKIATWRSQIHKKSASQLAYQILSDSGLKDQLYNAAMKDDAAAESVRALGKWFESLRSFEAASTLGTAAAYLESFEVIRAEGEQLDESVFDINLVTVMSVHKSKGLEWDTIYIADCTEQSFPLRNNKTSLSVPEELSVHSVADDHYAEERRLMYVAATRAKQELILTYSDTHSGVTKRRPSRFLKEMFGNASEEHAVNASQTSLDLLGASSSEQRRPGIPPSMLSDGMLVLSASQINDYMRCPQDFYFRHILHVPSESTPASAVGTLFHGIIQRIHESRINGNILPSLEDVQATMRDAWPQEGFLSAKQRERALKQAMDALKVEYGLLASGEVPTHSELPFRVQVPDSKLLVTGRIDAVFEDKSGATIVDYKTSSTASTDEKAKRKTTSSKQLELYALAWREMRGEMPKSLELHFVMTHTKGAVKKKEATVDKLAQKLRELETAVRSGEFPLGKEHEYCRHP